MTSDLGRSCFDGVVHITYILQAFCGLSSLPQGFLEGPKHASHDFCTCIFVDLLRFCQIWSDLVRFCQILSDFVRSRQIWSDLVRFRA